MKFSSVRSAPLGASVVMLLALGAPSTAAEDPCAGLDLILCGGSDVQGDEQKAAGERPDKAPARPDPQDVHRPVAAKNGGKPDDSKNDDDASILTHQDPHEQTSEYLGNDTCRYYGTRYQDGDFFGDANFGVDDSLGMYASADARSPFLLPGSASSWAWGRGGVVIYLGENWPQPSSVTVTYPWHTQGRLDVNAEEGASAEARHETIHQLWRESELAATATPVNVSLSTSFGPRTVDIDRDGTTSLKISTPADLTYYGLSVNLAEAEAESGFVRTSRGVSQFFADVWHVWLDYEDWHFDLPDGWSISSCS